MKIDELNQANTPIIVFDKKLESLRGKVLFPDKLKKANDILAKSGLPKKRLGKDFDGYRDSGNIHLLAR